MTRFLPAALLVCLLGLTTPAFAHQPIMGIGGVFGGVLHALLIPEHGLSLVALGLALGRENQRSRRIGWVIFTVTLICGLIATLVVESTLAADVLLAATGILALLVALAWVPAWLVWVLAGIAGLVFALDSPAEAVATDEAIRRLIGSGIGAAVTLAIVAEGSVVAREGTPRIAVRILGSWIAAIAILDLSLRIVTRIVIA